MTLPDPALVYGPVGQRLVIPTHINLEGGEATHPSIVFFAEPWNGYRYWMAVTPYPGGNDDDEDPNIVASHDGITWEVPTGLVNPIDDQLGTPIYNSDVDLRLGPDNTLYLFWRTLDTSGGSPGTEEKLYFSTSIDGVTWAAKTLVYQSDMTVRRLVSPAFHYEGGVWYMWAVDIAPSPNQVVRLVGSSTPNGVWGDPVGVSMGPMRSGKEAWHLDVQRVSDGYLAMLADCDEDTSGQNVGLLFCTSTDGLTFANSGHTVIPQEDPANHDSLYRATFMPEIVGNQYGWRVWYSAYTVVPTVWGIFRTWITAGQIVTPEINVPDDNDNQAVPTQTITWMACDLLTGEAITFLGGVQGDLSRAIASVESATLTIPTPLSGPLANRLVTAQVTAPNTVVVAIVNEVPAWAGIVWTTEETSEGGYRLGTATPESFFDTVYTKNLSFEQVEQTEIVRSLAQRAVDNGFPLAFDITPTGVLRDRNYKDDEDAKVLARLQELHEVVDGPEWTIDTVWADSTKRKIQFVLKVAAKLGSGQNSPKGPISTHGPAKATWKLTHDWRNGKGANAIVAVASGQGEDRLQSEEISNVLDSYPKIEYRWMPSSSIDRKDTLNDHAFGKLNEIGNGTRVLEMECRWDQAPVRLEVDLHLGDWVIYQLYGPTRPTGMTGVERMLGWKLSTSSGRFTPYLLQNGD